MPEKPKKPKSKRENNFFYDFVKITGALPALIWLRPKIIYMGDTRHTKIKGGVLVTSNHASFTDPVTMLCTFWNKRPGFLATKELYSSKLKNFLFTHFHCVKVDKNNFGLGSFRGVIAELKKGRPVIIFPEGEVNRSGEEMLSFKSGAVYMAQKAGVPILPVCIIKPKRWYNRVRVLIGDLIDVAALCGDRPKSDDLARVSAIVRDRELALIRTFTGEASSEEKAEDTDRADNADTAETKV